MRGGSAALAEICAREVHTISDVVERLTELYAEAVLHPPRAADDGIACFTSLYLTITQNVQDTAAGRRELEFRDPEFLLLLDVEFARRYFAAFRRAEPPRSWQVLFGRRTDEIGMVNFAAAGVNAHVNFDLTFALLRTWERMPPRDDRTWADYRHDYGLVNDIFAQEMDDLRERFDAFLAEIGEDGNPADELGNEASELLVRVTRWLAWEAAEEVWEHYDAALPGGGAAYRRAWDRVERRLDRNGAFLGWLILTAPTLP